MLRIPPMFLMSGGLVAQALLPPSPGGPRWWQWGLSLPIALAGLALLFGSSMRFYRAGVSANPVDVERPRALVRDGVYRLTRNPMYVAMAAILACFALLVGLLQVPAEEAALRRAFPKEYEEYAKSVPRWLGRPR